MKKSSKKYETKPNINKYLFTFEIKMFLLRFEKSYFCNAKKSDAELKDKKQYREAIWQLYIPR